MIQLIILGFLQIPTPAYAMAQQHWVDQIGSVIGTVGNMALQANRQRSSQAQSAAALQAAAPRPVPAKFFPFCQVAPAGPSFPEGMAMVCKQGVQDVNQLQQAEMMVSLGIMQDDFYKQLLTKGSSSRVPVGMQCLEDARKNMMSSMKDRMNGLQNIINNIKKQNQLFKENNRPLQENMTDLAGDLFGNKQRAGGRDNRNDSNTFAKFLQPQCRSMLGGPAPLNQLGKAGGLSSIRDKYEEFNHSGAQYLGNKGRIEKDLDRKVQGIAKEIRTRGIDDSLQGFTSLRDSKGANVNPAIQSVVQKEAEKLNIARKRIKENLNREVPGMGDRFTNMDTNFKTDIKDFIAEAGTHLRKEFVSDCVTGNGQTNFGVTPAQVLKGLRQVGVSGGNTMDVYLTQYNNIMALDAPIQDKLVQLERLAKQHPDVVLETKNFDNGKKEDLTPFQVFRSNINACEQAFEQDETFGSQQKASMKRRVDRAKRYLNELRGLESNFAANLINSINDEVKNCNGSDFQDADGQCTKGFLAPSNPKFCFKHANTCAANMQACFAQIDAVVTTKKRQLETVRRQYNANVAGFVSAQEAFLGQMKQQVGQDVAFLRSIFPGADFEIPKDLFVDLPSEQFCPKFGGDVRGGCDGIEKFANDMPKKLEKLMAMVDQQAQNIDSTIGEYMSGLAAQMNENRNKFARLKQDCAGAAAAFRQQVQQQNQQQLADFNEKKGEASKFCARFNQVAENPTAGCDKAEDLYSDSVEVASFLSEESQAYISDYKRLCASSQSEKDEGKEEDSGAPTLDIENMCEDGADKEEIMAKVKKQINSNFPKAYASKKSAIMALLNDSSVKTTANLRTKLKALAKGNSKLEGLEDSALASTMRKYINLDKGGANGAPTESKIKADAKTRMADLVRPYLSVQGKTNLANGSLNLNSKADLLANKSSTLTSAETSLGDASKWYDKVKTAAGEVKDGICGISKAKAVAAALNDSETAAEFESSVTKNEEKFKKDSGFKSIGRSIASMRLQSQKPDFSELGERFGGEVSCVATNGGAQGKGGLAGALQGFDQCIISGGANCGSAFGIAK
ncbi:MAG: hypothetical protein HN509_15165 [Halobacteriovoraceae bacterium]|nr:hypothetical protein [Halobacteriovoraceae bacterium]MBT5094030.1 hypothetical protein [Halobacteriovoraceae bacterium]